MTEITVVRADDGTVTGFEAAGHSGAEPAGRNVTCASITILFEFFSEIAEELPERGITFRQDPETTHWTIKFHPGQLSEKDRYLVQTVTEQGLSVFRKLEQRDPGSCRILDPDG